MYILLHIIIWYWYIPWHLYYDGIDQGIAVVWIKCCLLENHFSFLNVIASVALSKYLNLYWKSYIQQSTSMQNFAHLAWPLK